MSEETNRLLELARDAAGQAGSVIHQRIGTIRQVETKSSYRDLVTDVDREIEQLLQKLLLHETPTYEWVGEETTYATLERGQATNHPVDPETHRWIVDPLDGTTNFVNGVPFCCVSIALYRGDSGVLGVVYDPFREELFDAVSGVGARLNGRAISVQRDVSLRDALLVTGFPDQDEGLTQNLDILSTMLPAVGKVRAMGSAALELAYVAAGRFAGFWELKLSPWDTAAGSLLVQEAGGRVTTLQGVQHSPRNPSILATNGSLHDELLSLIASAAERNSN